MKKKERKEQKKRRKKKKKKENLAKRNRAWVFPLAICNT